MAEKEDPWEAEKVFLQLVGNKQPEAEARRYWLENRHQASRFGTTERTEEFINEAVRLGLEEITAFVNGGYCKMPCT